MPVTSPRVRYAPAPSGYLHVGTARAALYNWLYARHTGGTMVLRIEDTDAARSTDESFEAIVRGLRWLGIDWDEGPIRQSSRVDRHLGVAADLHANGAAYYCDCPAGATEACRCRDRGLEPGPGRALRFRVPDDGETVVHDVVRGDVRFAHDLIEDFVIVRSDGSATFLLPNAVDDVDMGITHVVRGEDLLNATPRVLLVRHAIGPADDPVYAHLPLIVDERRQKLSKRFHSVAVEEFREQGYLPEAMRNYLALLGWTPRDGVEITPVEEMVRQFELEDVTPSPAFFDLQKLDHVNATYIRALPVDVFVRESLPWLETDTPWPPERFDLTKFEALAPLVQERARKLADAPGLVDFVFLEEPVFDKASWDKVMTGPVAVAVVDDAVTEYESCDWTAAALHDVTAAIGERHGLRLGKAQAPIRVAVTGRAVGPPLFESLEVLGRDEVLARLRKARGKLAGA